MDTNQTAVNDETKLILDPSYFKKPTLSERIYYWLIFTKRTFFPEKPFRKVTGDKLPFSEKLGMWRSLSKNLLFPRNVDYSMFETMSMGKGTTRSTNV